MTDFRTKITPLTRGIIWIIPEQLDVSNSYYSEIDYLLDGLLTAKLNISELTSSCLIVGKNFNRPLYVMIIKKIVPNEVDSFVNLIRKELGQESDIIVIDETNKIGELKNNLKEIHSHLRSF